MASVSKNRYPKLLADWACYLKLLAQIRDNRSTLADGCPVLSGSVLPK